ncbi:hypothetical protein QJS10_CPA02g00754 [Acorus calamus]|uniref:tRNA pseudouridine synthase n=1 Tax=Acorus calamus TaxID=4465 RepID=A0AAV9FE54_ACOCL|nr:hypothetical protein QJS10_CPA02g00754 [Acorus calamus]
MASRDCESEPDSNPDHRRSIRSTEEDEEEERPAKHRRSDGGDGRGRPEGEMKQRYLVAVEYVGTRFSGSQQQPNCRTVVGVLQEAFHKFVGKPVSIFCSSRTDAGVHALSNVCHVDVERISKRKPDEVLPPHEAGVVKRAVNHFLQKNEGDIMLIDVRCVPPDFHARFKAQERIYFYRLLCGPEPLSTFEKERAWHIPEELDIFSMEQACNRLVGCHDFSSFRAAGCQANSPIRTLDELSVLEATPSPNFPCILGKDMVNTFKEQPLECSTSSEMESSTNSASGMHSNNGVSIAKCSELFGQRRSHRCYIVTARARSFLYHQVRLLVGVLKAVGTGELKISDVERILNAKTVTAASPMAPACGLYLGNVKYDFS